VAPWSGVSATPVAGNALVSCSPPLRRHSHRTWVGLGRQALAIARRLVPPWSSAPGRSDDQREKRG
jgi:hypothetical protein